MKNIILLHLSTWSTFGCIFIYFCDCTKSFSLVWFSPECDGIWHIHFFSNNPLSKHVNQRVVHLKTIFKLASREGSFLKIALRLHSMVRRADPGTPSISNKSVIYFSELLYDIILAITGCCWVIACIFQGTLKWSSIHMRLYTSRSIVRSHRASGKLSIITTSIMEKPKTSLCLTKVETICLQRSCQLHRCFKLVAIINYIFLQGCLTKPTRLAWFVFYCLV